MLALRLIQLLLEAGFRLLSAKQGQRSCVAAGLGLRTNR